MSEIDAFLLDDLGEAIRNARSGGSSSKVYQAIVVEKDDEGTPWVMISGETKTTPVSIFSADFEIGDTVQVRIEHGKASITGNISNPSASVSSVERVGQAVDAVRGDVVRTNEIIQADRAYFNAMVADKADIADLEANYAHISNGVIDNAEIGYADVNGLSANYAQINAANITSAALRDAWIDKVMVQSGLIAHEGVVYSLDAVQVNAANITAGTIDVERLIVTYNGEKYMVHVENGATVYQKLDGDVIEDLTITADKIVAGAVTAQKITTENLVGTGGWINLHNGTFAYANAVSGQGIAWDGTNLTISGSVTVGGSDILLSSIAEMATATLILDVTEDYETVPGSVVLTAHIYQGGVDIASSYSDSDFAWFRKNESGQTALVPLPSPYTNGKTVQVARSDAGYGATIVCRFTEPQDAELLTGDDDALTDSDDTPLAARTPSGDYVRVADLTVETTVFDSDKLMVVGSGDEHLVTMATLRGYLESTMAKQVRFGTTAEWTAQSSLVSEHGVLYVYTDHGTDQYGNALAGIKAGDGNAYVVDLPFTDAVLTEHIADTTRHVTAAERAFWNSKVRAYYAGTEQLVLTTS